MILAKKSLNPMNPGMDRPYTKSPVLNGGGKPVKTSPILTDSVTPKGVMEQATKPNMKDMKKSINPTVRSKPYDQNY